MKFVPGTLGTRELERMVKSTGEAAAAFHLRPVSFAEMKGVADGGCCMPPRLLYRTEAAQWFADLFTGGSLMDPSALARNYAAVKALHRTLPSLP